jgi:hypothetical protein
MLLKVVGTAKPFELIAIGARNSEASNACVPMMQKVEGGEGKERS